MNVRPLLVSLVTLSFVCASSANAATYYVDSTSGSDSSSGTTATTPWASLTQVNSKTFLPGDRILFKRGCRWTGRLAPMGSGAKANVITVDTYSTGHLPVLNGNGSVDSTIALNGQSYWTIQNLELTNDAPSAAVRSGVLVQAVDKVSAGITLRHLFVHSVNGVSAWGTDKWSNAGIRINVWQDPATRPPAGCPDLLVDDCTVQDVHEIGVLMLSNSTQLSAHVVVRDNLINRTGADGIVLQDCANPRMTGNRCYYAGKLSDDFKYIVGIWTMGCESPIIEGNEVAYTAVQVNDGKIFYGDSQAFDIDNGCTGTPIVQYNYSHDNGGGFFEVMPNSPVDSILVRYNISVDDGHTNCGQQTTVNLLRGKVYVDNNTFYDGSGLGITIHDMTNTHYRNNIFYSHGNCFYGTLPEYSHNCFFGHTPTVTDPGKVLEDPQFADPGRSAVGFETCNRYQLRGGSSCRGRGMKIAAAGGRDFFGTPLRNDVSDIGAFKVLSNSKRDREKRPATKP